MYTLRKTSKQQQHLPPNRKWQGEKRKSNIGRKSVQVQVAIDSKAPAPVVVAIV
jgi:hypothetical protein